MMKSRLCRKWKALLAAAFFCAVFSGMVFAEEDGRTVPYRKDDFRKATVLQDKDALARHAEAQAQLCVMYRDGSGVKKNDATAVKLCEKAARAGSARGQYFLAGMYETGVGAIVRKNEVTALKWYSDSGDQGYVPAQLKIGDIFRDGRGIRQDYAVAMKWYMKAAEQGSTDAMNRIGRLYSEGKGVKRNEGEAMAWYRRAALQDNVLLQDMLSIGSMYVQDGTQKDTAEAIRVYREAAGQGMPEAQYMMGIVYVKGEGVPKNRAEAIKWFEMAVSGGHEDARKKLAQLKQK